MPYIVDNETAAKFTRNHAMMKKVRRVNSVAFFVFLIGGLIMILSSFLSITGTAWDWLMGATGNRYYAHVAFIMILDSVIVCTLAFYLTYRVSLLHHSLSGLIVIPILIANLVFILILHKKGFFGLIGAPYYAMVTYCIVCTIAAAANMWAVIKYHWLEDQEGFPQFNARFEEYKEKRREREIMDPYELRKRELQRASTDEMSDLGTTQDELAQYEKVHVQSNMDSI